ncbi:hypothetical protein ACT2VS_000258 [Stenotrophomonas bentonitica]
MFFWKHMQWAWRKMGNHRFQGVAVHSIGSSSSQASVALQAVASQTNDKQQATIGTQTLSVAEISNRPAEAAAAAPTYPALQDPVGVALERSSPRVFRTFMELMVSEGYMPWEIQEEVFMQSGTPQQVGMLLTQIRRNSDALDAFPRLLAQAKAAERE